MEKISANGLAFIKSEEGERLTAYPDSRGIWTIGVGHTGMVDNQPIAKDLSISQNKSTDLLLSDLAWVEKTISDKVKVPLTQNQYDAICSLIFNIGATAFIGSSVLKYLNKGNYLQAASAFLLWKRAGNDANILLPRRQREKALFLI